MNSDELNDVQRLIGLLAMPSTQVTHLYVDAVFDIIVKYGDEVHVNSIARRVYGHKAAEMVASTKKRIEW